LRSVRACRALSSGGAGRARRTCRPLSAVRARRTGVSL
jgi:hypothetical protein